MHTGQQSRTAVSAATHRAVHQVLEHGCIFADPLALPILGEPVASLLADAADDRGRAAMRWFIAARSRLAEAALAQAVGRGMRQLVVLGAGLDTFAYRNPHAGLRVFEVDHPATQAWKCGRLAAAGIAVPASLTFAPIDFEHETLEGALAAAGFDAQHAAFFTWLGVVPYLTEQAAFRTLAAIAALPRGTEVVFDYSDPPSTLPPAARAAHDARSARVAALGEPWLSHFEPAELATRLTALGFAGIEDVGPAQIAARCFPGHAIPAPQRGGHVIRAQRR